MVIIPLEAPDSIEVLITHLINKFLNIAKAEYNMKTSL